MRQTLLHRARPVSQFATVDIYALLDIVVVALTGLALLLHVRLREPRSHVWRTSVGALVLYYAICAISALWSPLPEYTLFRALEYLVFLCAVIVALAHYPVFVRAERVALLLCAASLMLSVLRHLTFEGFDPAELGWWHTNSFSASATMLFCYCSSELCIRTSRTKAVLILCCLTAFACLVLGTASASYIACICGLLVTSVVLRSSRAMPFILFLAGLALAACFWPGLVRALLFRGRSDEAIVTMTGRTDMWAEFAEGIVRSPLVGNGFAASTHLSTGRQASNTHNAVFAVLLGTGLAGMAAFACWLARTAKEALRNARLGRVGAVGCMSAIAAGLAHSMTIPFVGEQWMVPSFTLACILGLHMRLAANHDHGPACSGFTNELRRGLGCAGSTPERKKIACG